MKLVFRLVAGAALLRQGELGERSGHVMGRRGVAGGAVDITVGGRVHGFFIDEEGYLVPRLVGLVEPLGAVTGEAGVLIEGAGAVAVQRHP